MSTSSFDFLVEEEAQVVPSSLDHLSRHELCHMIYRLDYERHTLKEKLVALRLAVSASKVTIGPAAGGVRRGRVNQTTSQLSLSEGDVIIPVKDNDDSEEKVAKRQKANEYECHDFLQKPEPTPLEINAIYNRLTQTVISEIKSTTHGGLRKPHTTAEENDISVTTAMFIMQHWGDKLTHNTKRMIKWKFTSNDDIAKYLQCKEKYLSGVRHNGKGFLVGSGTSSCLQYAKFELMVVSYDKLKMAMKIQVTTRGCTENGK
mmetsp:Transcript_20070/g.32994  ORF Transcript_20070/g.32994 Transcript_20070/m.32994 type:complete len:260 (-) Transcript_20070:234-1013(-)